MVAVDDKHFGQWLRGRIERLGIKKATAAAKIGVAAVTLRSWFNAFAPGVAAHNRVQLARLIGVEVEEIERRLAEAAALGDDYERGVGAGLRIGLAGKREDPPFEDRSIEPYSEVAGFEIPTFELSVAAGQWVDVSDVEGVCDERQAERGYFRVRIAGESMSPDFKDGEVVEFRCLRLDREGPVVGREYYVQRGDGTATFKQLAAVEGEAEDRALILRAINAKKFPKAMRALWSDVSRIAEAIGVFRPRR